MRATMIYLIRHGETVCNARRIVQQTDTPLSARGALQAERVAARLADVGLTRIIASDYRRARQTAAALAQGGTVPLELTPLLRERDLGRLRGRPYAEVEHLFYTVMTTRRTASLGAVSGPGVGGVGPHPPGGQGRRLPGQGRRGHTWSGLPRTGRAPIGARTRRITADLVSKRIGDAHRRGAALDTAAPGLCEPSRRSVTPAASSEHL